MTINPVLLLQNIYETVTDFAIMTTDMNSRITSWNAGACAIFGYRTEDVLGTSTAITFTDTDIAAGQPFLEMNTATLHGRATDYRWHVRRDRTLFWADGILTPIRGDDGEVVGFLKILRDITDRKQAQDEIKRLASIDALTGLYNRAAFDARRHEMVASAFRNGHKLLLFMIDLDRFKEINDTQGHQVGDHVLQVASARIRAISRESDIVARIGGDEFALLQTQPVSSLSGATLASKILDALAVPIPNGERDTYVSGSIGIAVIPTMPPRPTVCSNAPTWHCTPQKPRAAIAITTSPTHWTGSPTAGIWSRPSCGDWRRRIRSNCATSLSWMPTPINRSDWSHCYVSSTVPCWPLPALTM